MKDQASLSGILPRLIYESKLQKDAVSRSNAVGYGQLKDDAINDVNKLLKDRGINPKDFDPVKKGSDNCMYVLIYDQYVHSRLKSGGIEKDIDDFKNMAYNAGVTKTINMYNDLGEPSSREKFVGIVLDEAGIDVDGVKKTDTNYGVEGYVDYFDKNANTLAQDSSVIWKNGQNALTKSKMYEMIRYVEMIRAIKKSINQDVNKYDTFKFKQEGNSNTLFNQLKGFLNEKVSNLELKEGSQQVLRARIAIDNGVTDKHMPDKDMDLLVSEYLVEPYIVPKEIKKYATGYTKITYNKLTGKFLWSIMDTMAQDIAFVKKIKPLASIFTEGIDDMSDEQKLRESRSLVRQFLMDATTVYNKSLRAGRKDTAGKDVWIPTIEFFNEFDNLKDILKKADVEQQIEKNEMNKTVFDIGNIGEVSVDAGLDQKMKEPLSPIGKCVTKKIYNSSMEKANAIHGTTKPDKIIIHGTESREAHNESNKTAINKFLSHYYISQEGIIYQYVLGNEGSSGPIELGEKIVSINHAGIDKDPVYGAIRDGDGNLTYKSIGIEVETVEKGQPSEDQIKILKLLVTQLSSHYNIPIKNILTHADVAATKEYGRGRKSDLSGFDTGRITGISNGKLIDWDVAKGEVCPNMTAVVKEYIGRGISVSTIKKILEGRNVAIKILRNKVKNGEIKNYHNSIDPGARRTLEELQKLGILK